MVVQQQLGAIGALVSTNIALGIAVAFGFCLCLIVFPFLGRPRLLCILSLVSAACYFWRAFAGFLLVVAVAYGVASWLGRQKVVSWRWRAASLTLVALIVIFTLGRLRHWDKVLALSGPFPLVFYGLDMWLTLRLVTLLWEVGSGAVSLSLPMYLTWVCLPLTLGGPLLRYSQFPSQLKIEPGVFMLPKWWTDLAAAAAKLLLGGGMAAAQLWASVHWPGLPSKALAALLTGPFGFYLVAAGYFQLMEVFGRPCGLDLPMSFNFPIGRENISAFWMNWNMTATFVFRDYLFYNRWGFRTYNIYFNTILLFGLVGLWHDANAYWVLWGLLHGVLFCMFLWWRKHRDRLAFVPLRGTAAARVAARVLTYVAVCACWYLSSKILQKLAFI